MATNWLGIDIAEIEKDKNAIEGGKTINALNKLKLNDAKRMEANRPTKEAAATKQANTLATLRSKASTGDQEAQRKLLALDPEGAPKFIDAVNGMDDRQISEAKQNIDQMGNMVAEILNAPESQRPALYAQMREMIPADMKSKAPEQYNPNYLKLQVAKLKSMDQILENPQVRTVGTEDILYKGGSELERAKNPSKVKTQNENNNPSAGGSNDGMKSADESLMYRQSVELLGGIFDSSGNIQALDPELRGKVQSIATEATKIFKAESGISRTEAVAKAAKKYGIEIPSAQGDKQPVYKEGQRAKNSQTGEIMVYTNGKWVKEQ